MLCYFQIIVRILFGDDFPNKNMISSKIDRQRASFKIEGMQPEGWKTLFLLLAATNNHSLITVDAVLLQNNNESTFWQCFPNNR